MGTKPDKAIILRNLVNTQGQAWMFDPVPDHRVRVVRDRHQTEAVEPEEAYTSAEWRILKVRTPSPTMLARLNLVREVFDGEIVER